MGEVKGLGKVAGLIGEVEWLGFGLVVWEIAGLEQVEGLEKLRG